MCTTCARSIVPTKCHLAANGRARALCYFAVVAVMALGVVASAAYHTMHRGAGTSMAPLAVPGTLLRRNASATPRNRTQQQDTVVWSQDHPSSTLEYDGVVWNTPQQSRIYRVRSAQVAPDGLVSSAGGVHTFGKWYWQASAKQARAPQPARLENRSVVSLLQIWNDRFQHIAIDTLPKVAFCCQFLRDHPATSVLVMNELQRDLTAEYCPIALDRFSIVKAPLRAAEVFVPHFAGPGVSMGMVPPHSMRSLGAQRATGSRVVYAARRPGAARSVSNEVQVLAALRAMFPDLVVVQPTNVWREDRAVFATAWLIVGPHGGAMANMVFAPANSTVIEFLPIRRLAKRGENSRPCYFGLAHGLGFQYFSVEPQGFGFDKTMAVSLRELTNAVRAAVLARAGGTNNTETLAQRLGH
jgi:hypothetical protein